MHRHLVLAALLFAGLLPACGRARPGEVPPPATTAEDSDAAARAERERLAREEEERRRAAEEEARRAEEGAARARDVLTEPVYFEFDRFSIRSDAEDLLLRKVAILRANPDVRLSIQGHADERGSVEYNFALGMRRATATRDYLTGFGLDGGRFETVSFGEERPAVQGSDEEAWARNRRAEFRIVAGGERLTPPGPGM